MIAEKAWHGNWLRKLADHIPFSQRKKRENSKGGEAIKLQTLPLGHVL